MLIFWILCLFLTVNLRKAATTTLEDELGEVIFANVLHRHGDRTPESFYPNDPYKNAPYWSGKKGQLTNKGKVQTFKLGQWLRQRYDSLLTKVYSPDIIYIQSTDIDRTLMSAECVLAGMFPPKGTQVWIEDLDWQPIPVHTTQVNMDKILRQPPHTPCPAYELEFRRVFETDDKIKQLNETFSELFQWTNKHSGGNFSLWNWFKIYDTLFIENLNNLTLPEWTKRVFPQPMLEANTYTFMLPTWTPKLARFMTGLFLQDMINNMVDKIQNKTTKNIHMYSAHDETMGNILNALGAYNHALPPYASCLMLELRVASNGSYYVTLNYRNSTSQGPYLMKIAGCAPVCPLEQFISLSQPLIPEDWDQECTISHSLITSSPTLLLMLVPFLLQWLK